MDRVEFAKIMAYISASCSRELSADAAAVYYDLLGDLPSDALMSAAKQAVIENQYPVFPPVGVLRKLATDAMGGPQLTAMEAWDMARRAVGEMAHPEVQYVVRNRKWYPVEEWNEIIYKSLPPAVALALRRFGPLTMADNDTCRAQFRDAYTQIAQREKRDRLLPLSLKESLADLGRLPDEVKRLASGIGEPHDN